MPSGLPRPHRGRAGAGGRGRPQPRPGGRPRRAAEGVRGGQSLRGAGWGAGRPGARGRARWKVCGFDSSVFLRLNPPDYLVKDAVLSAKCTWALTTNIWVPRMEVRDPVRRSP